MSIAGNIPPSFSTPSHVAGPPKFSACILSVPQNQYLSYTQHLIPITRPNHNAQANTDNHPPPSAFLPLYPHPTSRYTLSSTYSPYPLEHIPFPFPSAHPRPVSEDPPPYHLQYPYYLNNPYKPY